MFSEKINNLINKNYITILKDIIESDRETFKQDVLRVDEKNNSLLVAFLKLKNEEAFAKELLEVLEDFNYSLKTKHKSIDDEKGLVRNISLKDDVLKDKKISDFLYILLENNNSKIVDLVVKKVEEKHKELFREIEQDGWNLFKIAAMRYSYGYLTKEGFEIIAKNCDKKLLEKEQQIILNILEKKDDGIKIFWETKNGVKETEVMKNEEFSHFISLLSRKVGMIYNKKSEETQVIVDSVLNKKDRFTKEQRDKILEVSLECTDKRLFKEVLKSFGMTMRSKDAREIVLGNLEKTSNMDYCYLFLNKEEMFQQTKKGLYGFETISNHLSKHYITLSVSSRSYRKVEDKYNVAIINRLRETCQKEGYEFLYENKIGEYSLFDIYVEKLSGKSNLVNILEFFNVRFDKNGVLQFNGLTKEDIEKNSLNNEQKKEIQDFLDNLWFKKDKEGKMNIEKIPLNKLNGLEVFKSEVLINCLNEEQNKIFFSFLANNIKDIYSKHKNQFGFQNDNLEKFFKTKYEEFKLNKEINWKELNIRDESLEEIKDSELYFEIKAILFANNLNKELANKKEVKKSIKI